MEETSGAWLGKGGYTEGELDTSDVFVLLAGRLVFVKYASPARGVERAASGHPTFNCKRKNFKLRYRGSGTFLRRVESTPTKGHSSNVPGGLYKNARNNPSWRDPCLLITCGSPI